MKHKKILFDEIFGPTKEELFKKKVQRENRLRFIFFGIIKWFLIIVVSLGASLLLTAALTSVLQERSFSSVISEFADKIQKAV